jgi:hypothetical protein
MTEIHTRKTDPQKTAQQRAELLVLERVERPGVVLEMRGRRNLSGFQLLYVVPLIKKNMIWCE